MGNYGKICEHMGKQRKILGKWQVAALDRHHHIHHIPINPYWLYPYRSHTPIIFLWKIPVKNPLDQAPSTRRPCLCKPQSDGKVQLARGLHVHHPINLLRCPQWRECCWKYNPIFVWIIWTYPPNSTNFCLELFCTHSYWSYLHQLSYLRSTVYIYIYTPTFHGMGSVQDLHSEMKGYLGKLGNMMGNMMGNILDHDDEAVFLYLSRDTLWEI